MLILFKWLPNTLPTPPLAAFRLSVIVHHWFEYHHLVPTLHVGISCTVLHVYTIAAFRIKGCIWQRKMATFCCEVKLQILRRHRPPRDATNVAVYKAIPAPLDIQGNSDGTLYKDLQIDMAGEPEQGRGNGPFPDTVTCFSRSHLVVRHFRRTATFHRPQSVQAHWAQSLPIRPVAKFAYQRLKSEPVTQLFNVPISQFLRASNLPSAPALVTYLGR